MHRKQNVTRGKGVHKIKMELWLQFPNLFIEHKLFDCYVYFIEKTWSHEKTTLSFVSFFQKFSMCRSKIISLHTESGQQLIHIPKLFKAVSLQT